MLPRALLPAALLLAVAAPASATLTLEVACYGGETDPTALGLGAGLYVRPVGIEIWSEANGLPGLQPTDRVCSDGSRTPADAMWAVDNPLELCAPQLHICVL